METIVFFKLFGLYFLGVGLAFLLNPERVRNVYKIMLDSDAFLYFGGVLALLLGATIISLHNVWVVGLPVIITILGWMCLVKGVGLLCTSEFAKSFSFLFEKPDLFFRIMGAVMAAFGLFLLYLGF